MFRQFDYAVTVEQDWIDVTSGLSALDPEWRGVDANGHTHHGNNLRSSCRAVYKPRFHSVDLDEMEVCWECLICGAEVTPGIIPPLQRQQIPGMRRMIVEHFDGTVWAITDHEQVEQWLRDGRSICPEMLDAVGVRTRWRV